MPIGGVDAGRAVRRVPDDGDRGGLVLRLQDSRILGLHTAELSNHFAITFINNVTLNGPGPDNNFHLRLNRHLTFNANGEITSVVDNFTVDCN